VNTPDQPPAEPVARGSITITADLTKGGIFVSLATTGAYSDEAIARRFYSYPSPPPPWVGPTEFWARVLTDIGWFLEPGRPNPSTRGT
jgi:hypothetical protein